MEEKESVDDFMIPKEAMDKLNDPELLRRYVEEGKTFQEILGYNDAAMDEFYRIARYLFEEQRFQEASDAFLFLTTLNPFIPDYWLGMGMCEQVNEEYKQALVAYSMVTMSEIEQPVAHYQSAACYHKLGDLDNALASLEKAIAQCGSEEEYAAIKEEAVRSRDLLMRRL